MAFILFGFLCAIKQALVGRREPGGRRPAGGAAQGVHHPAPAGELTRREWSAFPGWPLPPTKPGSAAFTRTRRISSCSARRAGGVPGHVSREFILPEAQKTSLARHPHRRHRRAQDRGAVPLENRRQGPDSFLDLAEGRRQPDLGVRHRRHLRRQGQEHRHDGGFLSLRLLRRSAARWARGRSAGTSSG